MVITGRIAYFFYTSKEGYVMKIGSEKNHRCVMCLALDWSRDENHANPLGHTSIVAALKHVSLKVISVVQKIDACNVHALAIQICCEHALYLYPLTLFEKNNQLSEKKGRCIINATAFNVYCKVPAISLPMRSQTQRAQLTAHELPSTLWRA